MSADPVSGTAQCDAELLDFPVVTRATTVADRSR